MTAISILAHRCFHHDGSDDFDLNDMAEVLHGGLCTETSSFASSISVVGVPLPDLVLSSTLLR